MQTIKPVILLDLDNTLFDTPSYRKSVFTKIGNFSVCQEIYDEMMRGRGYFLPEAFAKIVSERLGKRKEKIMDILFDPKTFKDKLHKEVLDSLKKLTLIGEVGILSQGDKKFQSAKIVHFQHLLNSSHVHIVADKKLDMLSIFKNLSDYKVYFVDDILPMLQAAKKIDPSIVTIWMRRGRYAQEQKEIPGFKPDAEITNLKELVSIINSKL